MTPEVRAFAAEYRALCMRHGLRITYDGGYLAMGVDRIDADLVDTEWELYPEGDLGNEMEDEDL